MSAAAAPGGGARAAILARVRAALATARWPADAVARPASPSPTPPARPRSPLEEAPPTVLRARFVAELDGLGVSVHDEPTADAAAGRVLALVGPRRLLAWEDAALPPSLAAALARLPPGQRIAPCAPLAEQASAEVGLTACDAAIAETGSLLLASAPGRPRTASMLPACHIAVVRDGDLHATLHGALAAVRAAHPHASGLHQITGPSRTADIELKLTLGVHGPGQVIVVLSP